MELSKTEQSQWEKHSLEQAWQKFTEVQRNAEKINRAKRAKMRCPNCGTLATTIKNGACSTCGE